MAAMGSAARPVARPLLRPGLHQLSVHADPGGRERAPTVTVEPQGGEG